MGFITMTTGFVGEIAALTVFGHHDTFDLHIVSDKSTPVKMIMILLILPSFIWKRRSQGERVRKRER